MLSAWLNTTITVQRKPANPSRNALGEPSYGAESSYPTVYSGIWCRIEFWDEKTEFTEVGERVIPVRLEMYIEPTYIIKPQDRITIVSTDASDLVGQLYIVEGIFPEWDSIGNVHHYMVELVVH